MHDFHLQSALEIETPIIGFGHVLIGQGHFGGKILTDVPDDITSDQGDIELLQTMTSSEFIVK